MGIMSETLSGGVQMIACSPIFRSRRTLSVIRSLSILLKGLIKYHKTHRVAKAGGIVHTVQLSK